MSSLSSAKEAASKTSQLMGELFPICRSLSGEGVRATHNILRQLIPLETTELRSGTPCFDWAIPPEWNIRDAYIADETGHRIVDFNKSNLHVLGYSSPIDRVMSFAELRPHLHTHPRFKDTIPYKTSYYREDWGFCLSENILMQFAHDGEYRVVIDSDLKEGGLTLSEFEIKGESQAEVIFSTYTCHPSMISDNLSGVVVTALLAKHMCDSFAGRKPKYTYRFLFVPETIGAIAWLAHKQRVPRHFVKAGFVMTCLAGRGQLNFKRAPGSETFVNWVVQDFLGKGGWSFQGLDYYPWGSDERQYCSPGIKMPFASLMRTPYEVFPEYHSSRDNLSMIDEDKFAEIFEVYFGLIDRLESEEFYHRPQPECEPFLTKHKLYNTLGGALKSDQLRCILWILHHSDGSKSFSQIIAETGEDPEMMHSSKQLLLRHGLIKHV